MCFKLMLSCYCGDYIWLDRHITFDPTMIHQIIKLSMQGPNPQDSYLGKAANCTLTQRIKDTYGDVEKWT
jgi:hypothetical protein